MSSITAANRGRAGLADLIERNRRLARRFAEALNQAWVSFGEEARTPQVIQRVQRDGTYWCGPAEWHGDAYQCLVVGARDEADHVRCRATSPEKGNQISCPWSK